MLGLRNKSSILNTSNCKQERSKKFAQKPKTDLYADSPQKASIDSNTCSRAGFGRVVKEPIKSPDKKPRHGVIAFRNSVFSARLRKQI